MKNFLLISFILFVSLVHAQSDKALVRQGNKSYQSDDFANAELDYRKALDKNPNSLSGTFNLADAIYSQEDYQKSAELFAKIGQADLGKSQKSMAYYNLGNSLLKAQQYEQSIEAYKMALRNNPTDEQARYNLEYARKMLKNQQENKDQNKDQDKKDQDKKDQNKQDDQKNDDQKDQDKDKQDKQDQNQEKPQENKDNQGKPEQQMNDQQTKQISKKDAERMLEALKNNEKKTLEKLKKDKKASVRVIKKEKDW